MEMPSSIQTITAWRLRAANRFRMSAPGRSGLSQETSTPIETSCRLPLGIFVLPTQAEGQLTVRIAFLVSSGKLFHACSGHRRTLTASLCPPRLGHSDRNSFSHTKKGAGIQNPSAFFTAMYINFYSCYRKPIKRYGRISHQSSQRPALNAQRSRTTAQRQPFNPPTHPLAPAPSPPSRSARCGS